MGRNISAALILGGCIIAAALLATGLYDTHVASKGFWVRTNRLTGEMAFCVPSSCEPVEVATSTTTTTLTPPIRVPGGNLKLIPRN